MGETGHEEATGQRHELLRQVLIDLAIMTVIGMLLAFVGPFGSFDAPLAWRFVYWLGYAYIGYACYRPVTVFATRMSERLDLPEWAMVVVGVLIGTIPMSIAVWVLGFLPNEVQWPSLDEALLTYFYVFLVGGGITLLFMLMQRGPGDAPMSGKRVSSPQAVPPVPASPADEGPAPTASTAKPSFLDRLPAHLGSDLLALEMEDHYVRAHTALGSELILLRLRDAVAELDGIDGAQVHRSWWVARDAVEDVKRDGRNVRLVLPGGLEAPVSRTRVAELKDAGWF